MYEGTENLEFAPQSFIVKVWLEETSAVGGRTAWRGHITHVPSGERQYIQELDRIASFIVPYLEAMGVELQRGGVQGRLSKFSSG